MNDAPPWGDYGHDMNGTLNMIAVYAKKHELSAEDVERTFNAGIGARSALLDKDERDAGPSALI